MQSAFIVYSRHTSEYAKLISKKYADKCAREEETKERAMDAVNKLADKIQKERGCDKSEAMSRALITAINVLYRQKEKDGE